MIEFESTFPPSTNNLQHKARLMRPCYVSKRIHFVLMCWRVVARRCNTDKHSFQHYIHEYLIRAGRRSALCMRLPCNTRVGSAMH